MNSFFTQWTANPANAELNRKIRAKHQGCIPVIVSPNTDLEPKIKKYKFIANRDVTLCQLMYVVRKYIELSSDEALFLYILSFDKITGGYVRTVLEPLSKTVGQVEAMHSSDGFLCIMYARESVFGDCT